MSSPIRLSECADCFESPDCEQTAICRFIGAIAVIVPHKNFSFEAVKFNLNTKCRYSDCQRGWSGGAMVLGKLPVPGRPTIWIIVGQGPAALVVGAGGVVWTFLLSSILFSPLSPSLWTARYRLKYCLKGPLSPKTTNQPTDCQRLLYVMHYP